MVDVKWIEYMLYRGISKESIILLTDLETVDVPCQRFKIMHHHQLTKLFSSTQLFDINLDDYHSRPHVASCIQGVRDRPHRRALAQYVLSKKCIINNLTHDGFLWSDDQWEWRIAPYISCWMNITSESFYETFDQYRPYTYLTEKTFKPIMSGTLGLHHGQHGGYAKLEDLGFRTARELGLTYDSITDDDLRFHTFKNEVDLLLDNLDVGKMAAIVKHNVQHFWNEFYHHVVQRNRIVEQHVLDYVDNYFR